MILSRGGLEIQSIWNRAAATLTEIDDRTRDLERRWSAGGDLDDAHNYFNSLRRGGLDHHEAAAKILNPLMSKFIESERERYRLFDRINDAYGDYNAADPSHADRGREIDQMEKQHQRLGEGMRDAALKAKAFAARAGVDTSRHFANNLPAPRTWEDHASNLNAAILFHDSRNKARLNSSMLQHVARMGSEEDAAALLRTLRHYDPAMREHESHADWQHIGNALFWRHQHALGDRPAYDDLPRQWE